MIHGFRHLAPSEGRGAVHCIRISWVGCTLFMSVATAFDDRYKALSTDPMPEDVPPSSLRGTLLPWCDGSAAWPEHLAIQERRALACGWPLHALVSAVASTSNATPAGSKRPVVTALHGWPLLPRLAFHFEAATLFTGVTLLPTLPLWRGFAADTALYSIIWFGLLVTPPFLRRSRRIRRGHCPDCGYDRLGDFSRPCPECGRLFAPLALSQKQAPGEAP